MRLGYSAYGTRNGPFALELIRAGGVSYHSEPGASFMKVRIDIFSDAICPWCYVGKKRLERAMAELSSVHQFDVKWHPFELNPNTPADGVPRQAYLSRKFGSSKQLRLMDD